ncbi:unnamed protein product [Dibothriocephalus latus]|uniref:Uncharacterized protein n=1 Tax=Dibothriocephalus latus TaxID=60516 RepID=A0A3P7NYM6_DIBLA|nr:unnamed protein product [Dibothriocephalus latus]
MLTILLIRVAMLPGSLVGVKYYLTPDFSKLKDATAWTDAATQLFFSLSCCNGGLIALSSYNKFNNNCCRDAIIVACINCATSIYAGFVVFSTLGFMAVSRGVGIADVATSGRCPSFCYFLKASQSTIATDDTSYLPSAIKIIKLILFPVCFSANRLFGVPLPGPGLVFIVYPEAINQMPLPVLWSVFFFLMLVTLGMGSQFPLVETLLSTAQDEFRRYGYLQTKASQMIFR